MALSATRPLLNLSFLRPLALPSASTLQRFLSTSTSHKQSIPSELLLSGSTPKISSSFPNAVSPAALPYRINRTPTSNLPIYLLAKRGGNLKQTKLRKIEGDINILRTQLRDALKLDDKEIVINQLTRQIIIKGWRKPEVARFLHERNF